MNTPSGGMRPHLEIYKLQVEWLSKLMKRCLSLRLGLRPMGWGHYPVHTVPFKNQERDTHCKISALDHFYNFKTIKINSKNIFCLLKVTSLDITLCELNQQMMEFSVKVTNVFVFSSRNYQDCFAKHEQRKQGAISSGYPGQGHGRPDGRLIGDHHREHHADRCQWQSTSLPPE